jgi:hypothetical protein
VVVIDAVTFGTVKTAKIIIGGLAGYPNQGDPLGTEARRMSWSVQDQTSWRAQRSNLVVDALSASGLLRRSAPRNDNYKSDPSTVL